VRERGEVVTDEHLRTASPRIWAAGDVTGAPQFVYVAAAQGTTAADNSFDGADRVLDYVNRHHQRQPPLAYGGRTAGRRRPKPSRALAVARSRAARPGCPTHRPQDRLHPRLQRRRDHDIVVKATKDAS